MWHLRSGSIQLHLNIESKQKRWGVKQSYMIGRKSSLHKRSDIIELLQSCLPYQSEARQKVELDEANQMLEDVKAQLEAIVSKLKL